VVLRRVGVVGLMVGLALVAFSVPAWAHVTISPDRAQKGASDVEIAIRVPNEETTPTTKVQVFFPTSPPFSSVLPEAVPGWTVSVITSKLAKPIHTDDGDITDVVTEATWTADTGGGIPVGEYQRFQVIVGQMPSTATAVTLKALQTYANGDIVRWIEDPSGPNPAPVLQITSGSGGTTTANTTPATPASTSGLAKKSQVDSAKSVGLVALIIGVVALLVALGGFVVGRRTRTA
jgi:uncharacterized protein YcnI